MPDAVTPPASALTGAPRHRWPRDLALTLAALAAVVAWDLSGLDLAVTSLFGSPSGFALRDYAAVIGSMRQQLQGAGAR